MPLTDNDFTSIRTLVESIVNENGQTLITSEVVKRDAARKLVWIKELDDQPIPVVDFNRMVDVYSFNAVDEDWHVVGAAGEPAFQNGWLNFAVGSWEVAAFYKDALGRVHIKGLVTGGTTTIFTLPVGYRPQYNLLWPTDTGTLVHGRVDVQPDGQVIRNGGGTSYFSINVSFRAYQSPPQISKRSENSSIATPAVGDTVVVALERGTRRLPRCLGVIQSTGYITAGDE